MMGAGGEDSKTILNENQYRTYKTVLAKTYDSVSRQSRLNKADALMLSFSSNLSSMVKC